jgi:RNA polymerase sigma factor (sigma-70 family)
VSRPGPQPGAHGLDPLVVVRARAGDAAAVEAVARRALTIALRVAASITGSRELAEDVAQDTALRALRSLRRLRDPARLDVWVTRMATTASLEQLRRPSRRESPHADPEPVGAADAAFDRIAAMPELRRALDRLSPRQRAALALRYVLDLDDAEIAFALGCRAGTVRALLSRGRSELRADPSLAALRPSPRRR